MIFTALTEDSLWCFEKDGVTTVGISEETVVLMENFVVFLKLQKVQTIIFLKLMY